MGLGGLGHMGVKLAHAMGAEVTVLSQSLKKHSGREAAGRGSFLRDLRSGDVQEAGAQLRPDRQHGFGGYRIGINT